MSLWDTVLGCLIIIGAIHRAEFTLTGHATLKLVAYLSRCSLFEWIGAAARYQRTSKKNQDRRGLHLLILGNERRIAIADCGYRIAERIDRINRIYGIDFKFQISFFRIQTIL